jgi:hypothetical protein
MDTEPPQMQMLQRYRPYRDTDCTQTETQHRHGPCTNADFTYIQTTNIISSLHISKSECHHVPAALRLIDTSAIVKEAWWCRGPVRTCTENLVPRGF